jgi:hypothetical protein
LILSLGRFPLGHPGLHAVEHHPGGDYAINRLLPISVPGLIFETLRHDSKTKSTLTAGVPYGLKRAFEKEGPLKRAAEGQQDVAEVSTALKIVLQGQEELD